MCQEFLSRGKIFRVKNCVKFHIWECLEVKMGQKIRPWVSEDFLGPKVTTPKFGGRQKFLRVWAYFWKFELWVKKFSKISHLQKGQKLSFFNICYFFLSFWAKWPKLPIIAQFCLPEISTSLGGTPWKLEFWLQMHLVQLNQLSRNFCRGSKNFCKNQNFEKCFKTYISVP